MKKTMRKVCAAAIVLVLALCCLPLNSLKAAESTSAVRGILESMTLRQKITQCLMVDFRQWNDAEGNPQDMTVLTDEVAELLADYQFGSVILFANNIKKTEETLALTKAMQAATTSKGGTNLIIATDQEGGTVYRLGSGTALPGNMALAATGDPENAKLAGGIIGSELEAVGINTTLSPVVDVNNNANNPVIGLRSFSDDPEVVGEFGTKYIEGLDQYNIIGCAKHFPGHGDTDTDSHYGLPTVNKSLDELLQCELKPFQTVIDQGVEMIMTAHILYPLVDDTTILSEKTGEEQARPATMSEKILNGLLREQMGYDGVIITDAMNMQGISDFFTMKQATLEALKAGADMICMPVTGICDKEQWETEMESIIGMVETEARSDAAFAEKLDGSVERILNLKEKKGILDYDAASYTVEQALASVGSEENRQLEREIAAKAVTVIRNENDVLPLKADPGEKILMLVPNDNEKAQMLMGLNRAREAGIVPGDAKAWVYRYAETDYEIAGELEKALEWADTVMVISEVTRSDRMTYQHWTSAAPKLYTDYCKKNNKTSIVLSTDKPYDVQLYPDADAILAVYGKKGSTVSGMPQLIYGETTESEDACGPNIVAGIEVAFGVFGASGKLPVSVPALDMETGTYTSQIVFEKGYGLEYGPVPVESDELKAPAIRSLKSGKQKLVVKMKAKPGKNGGAYYRISYRIAGSEEWTEVTADAKTCTISGLESKKKYEVRVCTCREENGREYYGPWSPVKTSGKVK